ncbi:helix-turn-helix domain-containing protein [Streptomyces sp. NPDC058746]|uniref:helix-turn-helix domain-containing protein n=1 Tax=Streptomyces sp. NPDC058746 TaxID=3346622 RepID=UPI0036C867C5
MADQELSAPSRVPSGIRHINHAHHRAYVKIGNHLAQHRRLSLTAIGLAAHIQSLPPGANVTIKALAARFPEGEVRIAAALRELEEHGYLARFRERLPSGRVVTCTVSYNNPPARFAEAARALRVPAARASEPVPTPDPEPEPAPDPDPDAPVPQAELEARELLARLRLRDPRLVLSERDTVRLAPAARRGRVAGAGARPERGGCRAHELAAADADPLPGGAARPPPAGTRTAPPAGLPGRGRGAAGPRDPPAPRVRGLRARHPLRHPGPLRRLRLRDRRRLKDVPARR